MREEENNHLFATALRLQKIAWCRVRLLRARAGAAASFDEIIHELLSVIDDMFDTEEMTGRRVT